MSDTKPTIEVVLERLSDFRVSLEQQISALRVGLDQRFDRIEERLEKLEDEVRSLTSQFETLTIRDLNVIPICAI